MFFIAFPIDVLKKTRFGNGFEKQSVLVCLDELQCINENLTDLVEKLQTENDDLRREITSLEQKLQVYHEKLTQAGHD